MRPIIGITSQYDQQIRRTMIETNIPTFKTVYRYIREGLINIKPYDLPVMYRLKPRRNRNSKTKGQNKKH